MRTLLLISPYFAPQASVAVYRWVKLARHLPRHGFRVIALTATFPEDARDEALLDVLPKEVEVADEYLDPALLSLGSAVTRVGERFAPPRAGPARPIEGLRPFKSLTDRCFVHGVHAARAASLLARERGADVVLVSAGPFSALPVGVSVKRSVGIPLVLDFRDPWGLHESGRGAPSGIGESARRRLVGALERRFLAAADHVILNTRRALAAYLERYPEIAGKASFLRNHFDMGLYADPGAPGQGRAGEGGRFTILHIGTLRKETTLDDIGAAMRILIEREGLTPADIVLRQIGRSTEHERRRAEELGLTPYYEVLPAVPHREVLGELRRSHVLLSMVDPRVDLRIAAKTYDYVASGMPIVSITTNPEVDELLVGRPDNIRVLPGDIAGLVDALGRRLALWKENRALPEPAPPLLELSSETAAERVATILERVIQERRS